MFVLLLVTKVNFTISFFYSICQFLKFQSWLIFTDWVSALTHILNLVCSTSLLVKKKRKKAFDRFWQEIKFPSDYHFLFVHDCSVHYNCQYKTLNSRNKNSSLLSIKIHNHLKSFKYANIEPKCIIRRKKKKGYKNYILKRHKFWMINGTKSLEALFNKIITQPLNNHVALSWSYRLVIYPKH